MTIDMLPAYGLADQSQAPPPRTSLGRRILREPLVHFLAIGGALFVFNAILFPAVPVERRIDVTPEVRQSIVETFKGERRRDPSPQELSYLVNTWVLNEITYREAMAQGLDKGDDMIRERLMQKMRVLIFNNLRVESPTDAELQLWLDGNRAQFDVPDLVTFSDVVFHGPNARVDAETAIDTLNGGKLPDTLRARIRAFADRPRQSLETTFGKELMTRIVALPLDTWQPLESAEGWHLVRLERITPGRRVEVAEIKDRLTTDWKEATARARAVQTIRDMGKNYAIEGVDPR